MPKTDNLDLEIALDFGGSRTKGVFTLKPFNLELITMEPEVVRVARPSIESYMDINVGGASPQDSAWVEYRDEIHAVGFLAKKSFSGNPGLGELKFERALYKVLAVVGAIAQQRKLPQKFTLGLGVLLPWGEYSDRKRFEHLVAEALHDYRFRGQQLSVVLQRFNCNPEGGGLLYLGRNSNFSLSNRNIAVVMIGYRNASALVVQRGNMTSGNTSELGFIRLLEKVQQVTSGIGDAQLSAAIYNAGPRVAEKALKALPRSTGAELRNQEISTIAESIKQLRPGYWSAIESWLQNVIPSDTDEVIISGGTAGYLHRLLSQHFQQFEVNWCDHLEDRILTAFPGQADSLQYRLTDVYGFFFGLQALHNSSSNQRVTQHA